MSFINNIIERAKQNKKTIILPESTDDRVLKASEIIIKEDIANLILIGNKKELESKSYNLDKCEIIDPLENRELTKKLQMELYELRKGKGLTVSDAYTLLTTDYMYYACMMVKMGYADGVVSGACHSTANTLRPALQIIKSDSIVSAFFLMEVPNCQYGNNGTFVFADCGLIQNPTEEELAEIAYQSSNSFAYLTESVPYVAMISHSTVGSAKGELVEKIVDATNTAKEKYPSLNIDGELQVDAAIDENVAKMKAPNSKVAGHANVLVFPNLDVGNTAYKLVERLAKAKAYGPITQGLKIPVNDLSRGCTSEDIVGVVAITAVQSMK